ncbi:unnamed protein product, partial [Mesorhabditis belari]|uniref:Lipid scramblase CLPTM1L n=1 Tax=Mesorhabditis belari TaxID=2138241 RepID=A0AAF3EZ39_9BILA
MFGFNLTSIVSSLFIIYIANSIYQFYQLFTPELCDVEKEAGECLEPIDYATKTSSPSYLLRVYTSVSSRPIPIGNLILQEEAFFLGEYYERKMNISLPDNMVKNGSLYVHIFLFPSDFKGSNPNAAAWRVIQSGLITTYSEPIPKAFNLMGSENTNQQQSTKKNKSPIKTVAHLRTSIPLTGLADPLSFKIKAIPHEIYRFLETAEVDEHLVYYPLLYFNTLGFRSKDLSEITLEQSEYPLTFDYRPSGIGKLRLMITASLSMQQLRNMGFNEKDLDEVKGIFVDTNLYLLGLTFLVSALHLLFDVLSFKNDISFWRQRKTMEGLSTKALLWRAFSYTIVFFYLFDQQTSLLVLVPSGISVLIEYWKCTKALRITISFRNGFPSINIGAPTAAEAETDAFDAQAMRWLAWLMLPLCIGGAVYSLAYVPHKSWYSWCIESLANGVYAFGFLFMLPQLFVNYKLKSVAHLPWRAFMYKAFNTFIDDLFAFIITMPTAHRVACFRDDVVFVIYLYQRWLYPIDYTRVNEYGEKGNSNAPNTSNNAGTQIEKPKSQRLKKDE